MILIIFFGILGLGIMVFVHEFGHFLAAKLVGIQVETFSLGWGKKMIGFDYKGTNYRISMIPVGGYCKMKGEDPLKRETNLKEGAFFAVTPWKRILVAAAGPVANIFFALIVLTLIWWAGFKIYSDDNRIILASEYTLDSFDTVLPATAAGLKTGDRIIAINGAPVDKFQDILERVSTAPNERLTCQVQRKDRLLNVQIIPDLDHQTGAGKIGVYAWRDPVVDKVRMDSSASIAGLQQGDRIVSLDGIQIRHTIDLFQGIKDRPEKVELRFFRENVPYTRTLVLHYDEKGLPDLGLTFKLGVFQSQKVHFPGALAKGFGETVKTLSITVKGIGLLFFRGVNFRNAVAGPLRITYYVGSVATSGFSLGLSQGLVSFFRFLCLLSVVLFLMNLLPIPALDGGQIMIFLLEIVRGKPVNPKIIYGIQMFGFSVLILLVVIATFSDILFFMGK